MPCKTAGKPRGNARRILERPRFDCLLFVTCSHTAPQSDVAALKGVVRVKHIRIVIFLRGDIVDAPAAKLKGLQHLDAFILQLLGNLWSQSSLTLACEIAIHACARWCCPC